MSADETTAACPWCGAALTDTTAARCGECGAVLRPDGVELEVPGVTIAPTDHHQPEVARAARTVEPEIESLTRVADETAVHEALGPPGPEVRRAMLALRLDELTAQEHLQQQPPAAGVSPDAGASERHPAPASFITEEQLELGAGTAAPGTRVRVGMSTPSSTDDGWWLAVVFAHDDDGIVVAEAVAPAGGPPAIPPLQTVGPVFAGALGGLIAEADGRQQLRLALPDGDPDRPWNRPLLMRVAIRWEPVRAETLGRDELARQVLVAFRRAIEAAGRRA